MAINRIVPVLTLPVLFIIGSCQGVGLISRPDITAVERAKARDQVAGTVERVDTRRNELHVRSADGLTSIIKYDAYTRALGPDNRVLMRFCALAIPCVCRWTATARNMPT